MSKFHKSSQAWKLNVFYSTMKHAHVGNYIPLVFQLVDLSDKEVAIATSHLSVSYVQHLLQQ